MFSSITLLTSLLLSITYHSILAQNSTSSGSTGATSSAAPTASITSLAAGLSTSCQTSAGSLLTSDLGSCANIIGLASVIGVPGSIVSPLNNWITAICNADPCSNSTLNSAQQTLSSGCGSDIQKGSPIALGLNAVIANYASVRNVLCSQYISNSTFCIPSILGNIQTASGQNLTLNEITTILTTGLTPSNFGKVSPGTYCNDCGHAIVTLSAPALTTTNASMSSSMASGSNSMAVSHNSSSSDSVSGVCGSSFNDGKIPSTVKVAAKGSSSAASNAQNGAGARPNVSFSHVITAFLAFSFLYLAC